MDILPASLTIHIEQTMELLLGAVHLFSLLSSQLDSDQINWIIIGLPLKRNPLTIFCNQTFEWHDHYNVSTKARLLQEKERFPLVISLTVHTTLN